MRAVEYVRAALPNGLLMMVCDCEGCRVVYVDAEHITDDLADALSVTASAETPPGSRS